jgi:protoporphyrinogen oxidase
MHPRLGPRERAWIARWPSAIPRLPLGHHATLAALELDLAALPQLFVTGHWRDGVAMGDRIARADELGRVVAATF